MADYYLARKGKFCIAPDTGYFSNAQAAIKQCVKGMWVIKQYLTDGGHTQIRKVIHEG
jgi:hypothetical protein